MKNHIEELLRFRLKDFLIEFGMEQHRFEEKTSIEIVVQRFTDDEVDILLGYLLEKVCPSPIFIQKFREIYSIALRRVNK
jgi:hypothetical protein